MQPPRRMLGLRRPCRVTRRAAAPRPSTRILQRRPRTSKPPSAMPEPIRWSATRRRSTGVIRATRSLRSPPCRKVAHRRAPWPRRRTRSRPPPPRSRRSPSRPPRKSPSGGPIRRPKARARRSGMTRWRRRPENTRSRQPTFRWPRRRCRLTRTKLERAAPNRSGSSGGVQPDHAVGSRAGLVVGMVIGLAMSAVVWRRWRHSGECEAN